MEEQKRLRAGQDDNLSGISQKLRVQGELIQALATTQSQHTATLDRHTAMHLKHSSDLGVLQRDVRLLKDGIQQIVGMLDTLIERENGR
jgi:hypothetical protein